MLQNILKIQGIRALSKTEQLHATGGNGCEYYMQFCYGPVPGCRSCNEYNMIPPEYQHCSRVHIDCVE